MKPTSRVRLIRNDSRSARRFAAAIASLLAGVAGFSGGNACAQTATGWTGTADSSWATTGNWDNSVPGDATTRNLFFGQGWQTAGGTGSATATANSDYNLYRLTFEDIGTIGATGDQSFTLTGTGILKFFDYGGSFPKIENLSSVPQTITNAIQLSGGATTKVELNAVNGDLTLGGGVTFTSPLDIYGNNGKTLTFGSTLAGGANALTLRENSVVILQGARTGTGDTNIYAGRLELAPGGSVGGAINLGNTSGTNNASLLIGGALTVGNNITVQSGSSGNTLTLGVNAAAAATFGGNVTLGTFGANPAKSITLVAAAGGSVNFSGVFNENTNNTGVASVTVGDGTNTGTVKLSGTTNAYNGSTTINGGTLEIAKINTGGSNSSIGNSGSSAAAGSAATGLVINGGTLKFTGTSGNGNTNRLFTIGTGGATVDASSADNTALTFTGTGALVAAGSGDRTLTLTGTSSAATGNSLKSVIANPGSGTTALIKSGSNSWTLTGPNTYTGTTTISGGTMKLAGAGVTIATDGDTATTSDIVINGGSLVLGANEQIANSGSIFMTSGSFGFGSASGLVETLDKFTNNGGSFSTGANTLISTGSTVTWAGGTNTIDAGGTVADHHWVISGGTNTVSAGVTGGTLQVATAGTAPTGLEFSGTGTPVITLMAAGGGEMAGRILLQNNVTVADALTGSAQILSSSQTNPGIVDMDGGTRTFTVNNGIAATDLLISASIQNGGLTKIGGGTLVLTGSNDYATGTTVSAGKLVVTNAATTSGNGGTGSGSVIVAAGATLAGTGRIAGATSFSAASGESRATHAVGDGTSGSTGVQYIGGNLSYGSDSVFEWDLRDNTTAAGSFDQVHVSGDLSVDSSTIFRIVLGGAVDLDGPFWSTPYSTQTWSNIFNVSPLSGGFDTANIEVTGIDVTGKGSFSITGTALTWHAVPELSNLLVGSVLGVGLLRRRR